MRLIWIFICVIWSWNVAAQTISTETDSVKKVYNLIKSDTIPNIAINLDAVFILPKLKLNNRKERIQYLILRRKTKKVYPYAIMAAERLDTLNSRLNRIEKRSEKKQYTRIVQRYINDEFKDELKKLSRTEGQILIKLLHRQTGISTFDLIKEMRSGWNAFWFNTKASLFDISLKEEFNPLEVKEDFYIEDILQRAFLDGSLKRRDAAFDVKYLDASAKWTPN